MSNVPNDLMYTKKHEWARINGNKVTVGLTDHAQEELTDIVYVELPKVGKDVKAGEELAVVESVKSTSDVYSPVSGKVIEINKNLESSPETINKDPYGNGWVAILETKNPNEPSLLTPEQYKKELA
jgi:glycine cleavage system H protein